MAGSEDLNEAPVLAAITIPAPLMLPQLAAASSGRGPGRQHGTMVARTNAKTGRLAVHSQRAEAPRASQPHLLCSVTALSQAAGTSAGMQGSPGPAREALAGLAHRAWGGGAGQSARSVWAALAARGLGDQGFAMHPALADAAIHAGAVLRGQDQGGSMVTVAIGCYAVQHALAGAPSISIMREPEHKLCSCRILPSSSFASFILQCLVAVQCTWPASCVLGTCLRLTSHVGLGARAAGEREVHAGAGLSASSLDGDVTSSHQVAASAGRAAESGMAPSCDCVAIGGVLARLLTLQLPAGVRAAGADAAQINAAAALASDRRTENARASRHGGHTPAGLAAGGPDPTWVPLFEETEEDALAAAAAPLIQLPPAAAPLPPHFGESVAALPIR